jgi:hypothetical protein
MDGRPREQPEIERLKARSRPAHRPSAAAAETEKQLCRHRWRHAGARAGNGGVGASAATAGALLWLSQTETSALCLRRAGEETSRDD